TNFCFGTDTAFLNQPDPITAFVSVSADASCNGNADGQASATVFGGTPGYSYSWSNGDTTNTLQLASAGTYYLTVTDANNCIYQDSIEISQPDVLSASAVASVFPSGDNISCNGASDGSIDLTVAGGTLPFTFVWSNNEQTEDISNLPPGTYTVDITDINGCSTQAVATLTEPTPLTVDTIFSPEYFGGWNVSCNGGTNGAVNIDVSGGSPGYTYYWSNGDTTQDISNVSVFIYYVTVTDVNGCIAQDSLLIDEPTLLDANVSAQTNVDCFGSSTGTITVAASGSTAPYQYSIDNGPFGSSFVFSNLAAGTYVIDVVDTNGCSTSITATISEPAAALSTAVNSQSDVACNGGSTGSASVTTSGGTTPYSFSLNNGPAGTDSTFQNLTAGSYNVLVTDANGCTSNAQFTINESTPISLSATSTPSNCNQNNGTVTAVASGGAEYFTYNWNPGGATTELVTGLAPGNYTVIVTDALGCTATTSVTVATTALLTATSTQTDNVCFGYTQGTAVVSAANGTGPYSYSWSPSGGNAATASNLAAGTYVCTITDQDNCTTTVTAVISEPTQVQASITTDPAACTGSASGSASVSAQGGTPGYAYVWSTGGTGSSVTGLAPGQISVTVTDNNGCTFTASETVSPASNVTATASSVGVTCYGYTDGSASVSNATGAYPPFTYLWSDGSTGTSVSDLSPGSYSVIVTDSRNCTITIPVSIGEPAQLSVSAGSDTSFCASTIELNASSNYAGQWSSSNSSISFSNPTSPTSSVTGYSQGVNVVTWTITDGVCSNSADVNLTLWGRAECELELPSGFTPNSDGFNDGYVIHGIGLYPDNVFKVFNRWGNLVYNRDDYQNADWIGQNNDGDLLPEGTYFVILEIVGNNIQKSTYVDLRRGKQ
ncbi:MAG: gliding motility-associated C-terminal domain-containing protein, partial [Bacteroidota bacterium]